MNIMRLKFVKEKVEHFYDDGHFIYRKYYSIQLYKDTEQFFIRLRFPKYNWKHSFCWKPKFAIGWIGIYRLPNEETKKVLIESFSIYWVGFSLFIRLKPVKNVCSFKTKEEFTENISKPFSEIPEKHHVS
jgi:hypothetical protein